MSKVVAQITTSLDGYITGPDDGPGVGLGIGGERLHYWVFGGPWSYDEEPTGEATGVDKELLDEAFADLGAVIGGRATYESAGAWGGSNPWGVPFFIVLTALRTHRRPRPGSFSSTELTRPSLERERRRATNTWASWEGQA